MIQSGSLLKVVDKTGVMLVKCVKVLGPSKKRIAFLGDLILVSVQSINAKKFLKLKGWKRKRYLKGTLHRALILRTKVNFKRKIGVYIKFNENSVILVTKKKIPLSNRVYGPVLRELCIKIPALGCIASYII